MADIYDVQVALTNLAQTAVYPNGISQASVANCPIRIYPGNPLPDSLDSDLLSGIANVSIFPGTSKATTRFQTIWNDTLLNTPTLGATFNTEFTTVTITGAITTPQTVMIIYNGIGYAYGVQAGDTLNIIAASLAAAIPGASATLNVINLVQAKSLNTNISVAGSTAREVGREMRNMAINVWASNALIRSQIGSAIMSYFASVYRVLLPDGYYGQLKFSSSDEKDYLEKVLCYKREIHFDFEYALTQTITTATVADTITNVTRVFTL